VSKSPLVDNISGSQTEGVGHIGKDQVRSSDVHHTVSSGSSLASYASSQHFENFLNAVPSTSVGT